MMYNQAMLFRALYKPSMREKASQEEYVANKRRKEPKNKANNKKKGSNGILRSLISLAIVLFNL